jgi:hypothetical protein
MGYTITVGIPAKIVKMIKLCMNRTTCKLDSINIHHRNLRLGLGFDRDRPAQTRAAKSSNIPGAANFNI